MCDVPMIVLAVVTAVAVAVAVVCVGRALRRTDALVDALATGEIPIGHPDPLLAMVAAWRLEAEVGPPSVDEAVTAW